MINPEYLVVVVGLLAGYWIVSTFMPSSKGKSKNPDSQAPSWQDIDHEFATAGAIDWAATLGISPAATVEEIRRAYKDQMDKYHPDKVAALGVELRDLAERKSKEINIAYKRAMKDRNVAEQLW